MDYTRITKKMLSFVSPYLRNYDLDIIGKENITDENAIFVCNHSNSHDFFTTQEVFNELGRDVTTFAGSDCLDFFTLQLFKVGDATLFDRSSKESSLNGLSEFSNKLIAGKDGVIFSEGTWNLHPVKTVLPMKAGAVRAALSSGKTIIPTVFEYVEIPEVVEREKELYDRCIVWFGKPIIIDKDDNVFQKMSMVQNEINDMRRELWKKIGIKKDSIDQVNKDIYLNHTYLKKFDALGFNYDSNHEFQYLLKDENGNVDNEYYIDENGNFVPGITNKQK